MNWNQIEPQIEKLKNGILSVMDKIEEVTTSNPKLPEVSSAMTTARNLIEHTSYDVVVCGKVNKGKSSLLNAIVGQEILPVNNEVATSQVFRITNNSTESFYLVFTDGTCKPISRCDLSRYVSQEGAYLQWESIFQDHTLAYIQINVPVEFLPKGISLVYTPGLGAMCKSHEWITQNYVSKASAVIFVMDPERPLVENEKEFILKVLDITPHLLFVMTKIDMYADDVINSVMERNSELLTLIYAEKQLEAPKIFPVSSTALMKVSTGKVQALQASNLRNSRFPQLQEQLLYVIYKTVGLQQICLALHEVANHTVKCKNVIADIIKVTENRQEIQRIIPVKTERQNLLNIEWGEHSNNRSRIQNEIDAVINGVCDFVQQLTSTSGEVYGHYERQIEAADSKEACYGIQANISRTIADEMEQRWATMCGEAKQKINNLLAQMETNLLDMSYTNARVDIKNTFSKLVLKDYIPEVRYAKGLGLFVDTILDGVLGSLVLSFIDTFALKRNKNYLKQNLTKGFNDVAAGVLHVNQGDHRSVVDSFVFALKQASEKAIQDIIERQKAQIQKELDDLQQQANLFIFKKIEEYRCWSSVKCEWEGIVREIESLVALRDEIAESLCIKTKQR